MVDPQTSDSDATGCAPTILVVDDDEDVRESVSLILQDEGYRVATANDGAQALAWLEREPDPCLILLDLVMPHMDGAVLLEKLRADPRLSKVPVAFLSAGNVRGAPGECTFLLKPVALERLLRFVEGHCHKAKGQAADRCAE